MTSEKEQDWYGRQSKAEHDAPFTIYELETLRHEGERTILAIAFAYGQDGYPDEDLGDALVERAPRDSGRAAPICRRMGRDRTYSPASMVGCLLRWVKTRIDARASEKGYQHGRHRQENQGGGDEGR